MTIEVIPSITPAPQIVLEAKDLSFDQVGSFVGVEIHGVVYAGWLSEILLSDDRGIIASITKGETEKVTLPKHHPVTVYHRRTK